MAPAIEPRPEPADGYLGHDHYGHRHHGHHDNHRHHMPPARTIVGGAIAAIGAYEVAALTVNNLLDEPVLPGPVQIITALDVRRAYAFLTPSWLRWGALLAGGAVLGALGIGAGAVAATQLDTPEERARAAARVTHHGKRLVEGARGLTASDSAGS